MKVRNIEERQRKVEIRVKNRRSTRGWNKEG